MAHPIYSHKNPLTAWTVFFVCLCVFFWLASPHLSEIVDDAFISFRYAKHFVEGKGLVYNEGERVEGYTNLLWVLLMAAGYEAGFEMPRVAQAVSVVCAAALVTAVAVFSKSYFRGLPLPFVSYLAPLLLTLNPLYLEHTRTGLATVLFSLLMFVSLLVYLNQERRASLPYLTGLLLGLGYLTRPEAAVWAFSFVTVDVSSLLLTREKLRERLWKILPYAGVFAAIVLLHMAWRVSYYGDWLPNTFYAKAKSNWFWGWIYTKRFLLSTGFLPFFAVGGGLILLRKKWALCMSLIISLFFLYNIQVGGDFIFTGRFLFPVLPLIYLLIQESARLTLSPVGSARVPYWKKILVSIPPVAVIVLFLLGARREWGVAKRHVENNRSLNNLALLLSDCIQENTHPSDTIATIASGILPYYSERNTIDMLGLNDRHIARHGIVDKVCFIGHQRTDSDYVLDRKPKIILVSREDPMTDLNAATRYMFRNPRFLELYALTELQCGDMRLQAFMRKDQSRKSTEQ